jgi:hypothetical protein
VIVRLAKTAMTCAANARKLSRSFGSESGVVLTRESDHIHARMRCALSGLIQLTADHCTACGGITLRACTRLQSRPSSEGLQEYPVW